MKVHLIRPVSYDTNAVMCGRYTENQTKLLKEVTCKTCLKLIENNKHWYHHQLLKDEFYYV